MARSFHRFALSPLLVIPIGLTLTSASALATEVLADSMSHDFYDCAGGIDIVNDGNFLTACSTRTRQNASTSLSNIYCSEDTNGDGAVDTSDNASLADSAEFVFTDLPTDATSFVLLVDLYRNMRIASGSLCRKSCSDWDGDGAPDLNLYPYVHLDVAIDYSLDGGVTWTSGFAQSIETDETLYTNVSIESGTPGYVSFSVPGGASEVLVRIGYEAGIEYCQRATRLDNIVVRVSRFTVASLSLSPQY